MWKFHQPVDVYLGPGESQNIKEIMEAKGLDQGLIVADPFAESSGLAAAVMAAAEGKILAVISEVEPNPTVRNVEACVEKAGELDARCLVAIGGGSAMDCAKSAAAAVRQGCSAGDLLEGAAVTDALPILAIPTTAGTGSEVTAGAVLSDKEKGVKRAIFGPALFPCASIVDPELTLTCPPAVTATTGIDVLSHSLDALTSVKANPATDALAVQATLLAFRYLERAYADGEDREARSGMSEACVLAGFAFSQTGTTGSHACSYILTSRYGIPHGEACALTLDGWFLLNARARPSLDDLSRTAGFSGADDLVSRLNRLKEALGLRTSLGAMGIPETDIERIVRASAASGNMKNNIYPVKEEDIYRIITDRK